ncbi:hypothetical protein NUW54_g13124 [Trametes sanguinea]|uniref:Uncharacterized protein n=1 Tax=Trametes sanguinea TaxID=158606 RepID=A0ACC1MR57_9APHY|nr:hypothetical protein NUW54_g13124 [Trametes sanguinea]
MKRGRPWHALQSQAFAMADSQDVHTREAAFRVFAGCPNLIMDLQTDAIISILQNGLQDQQSTERSQSSSAVVGQASCMTRAYRRFALRDLRAFLRRDSGCVVQSSSTLVFTPVRCRTCAPSLAVVFSAVSSSAAAGPSIARYPGLAGQRTSVRPTRYCLGLPPRRWVFAHTSGCLGAAQNVVRQPWATPIALALAGSAGGVPPSPLQRLARSSTAESVLFANRRGAHARCFMIFTLKRRCRFLPRSPRIIVLGAAQSVVRPLAPKKISVAPCDLAVSIPYPLEGGYCVTYARVAPSLWTACLVTCLREVASVMSFFRASQSPFVFESLHPSVSSGWRDAVGSLHRVIVLVARDGLDWTVQITLVPAVRTVPPVRVRCTILALRSMQSSRYAIVLAVLGSLRSDSPAATVGVVR